MGLRKIQMLGVGAAQKGLHTAQETQTAFFTNSWQTRPDPLRYKAVAVPGTWTEF